jgi:hypothetical protein
VTATLALAASLALAGMTVPPPPHATPWPVQYHQEVPGPDGPHMVVGWQDAAGFHHREADQAPHAIHLGTPLHVLFTGFCSPSLCNPDPPGAMPLPPGARPSFRGPPL